MRLALIWGIPCASGGLLAPGRHGGEAGGTSDTDERDASEHPEEGQRLVVGSEAFTGIRLGKDARLSDADDAISIGAGGMFRRRATPVASRTEMAAKAVPACGAGASTVPLPDATATVPLTPGAALPAAVRVLTVKLATELGCTEPDVGTTVQTPSGSGY